jgi:hypothetical protein
MDDQAGLDVTEDKSTVLTCAEILHARVMPPLSPRTPEHFVSTGSEATTHEDDGSTFERVAHLIQVALPPTDEPAPDPMQVTPPPMFLATTTPTARGHTERAAADGRCAGR